MPREINLEEIEQQAHRALQDKMAAVRDLVDKRESVIAARAALEDAEQRAQASYREAVAAGWTDAELASYGLGDVAPAGSKQRRATSPRARRPRSTQPSPSVDNSAVE